MSRDEIEVALLIRVLQQRTKELAQACERKDVAGMLRLAEMADVKTASLVSKLRAIYEATYLTSEYTEDTA